VVDGAKLGDLLKASTKTDDSPQSLGYALWAASNSYKAGQKLEIWDRIEDVIAQADEVDKIYLQFEGGLSVTGRFGVIFVYSKNLLNCMDFKYNVI